jgi:hypothetical protein
MALTRKASQLPISLQALPANEDPSSSKEDLRTYKASLFKKKVFEKKDCNTVSIERGEESRGGHFVPFVFSLKIGMTF